MELGIGMFGDLRLEKNAFRDPKSRLNEMLEEAKIADQSGIDVFTIGEHHRADYAISNPEILLAAAASVTKNIKLSSGVTVLSSAEPVRIYQNFSTIDLLSNGRAEITAGRGSFIESFPLFGYDLNQYSILFEEKLDLLLKINREENVSWTGKTRPEMINQTAYPRATKELPVWIAVGGTPESVLRAAKLGLPIIFAIIGGMPKQFKPLVDFYKNEYKAARHDVSKMQIGVHMHTFVGKDQSIKEKYFPYYKAQMDNIGQSRGWQPYSYEQFLGGISKDGALLVGEVEEVADKINTWKEMFGLTRFVAHMDVGDPEFDWMKDSIELFGQKVGALVK